MIRIFAIIALATLALGSTAAAGIDRIDISPMALVNLSEDNGIGDNTRLLGGAVAGDFYFSHNLAIRATVGYVRNLYNTQVSRIDQLFTDAEPIDDPNYSLRFSISPYAETNLGGGIRPYVTFNGSFAHSGGMTTQVSDIRSPVGSSISNSQYLPADRSGLSYYELSGSVGLKVPLAERISLFTEISHRFYSDYDTDFYYDAETAYRQVPFGFNEYNTLLSFGLSYSIPLGQ